MISVAICCLLVSNRQATKLPTYEEVQQHFYDDARKLKSYSDEWKWVTKAGDQTQETSTKRKIDGIRYRWEAFVEGKPASTNVYDGRTETVLVDSSKIYGQGDVPNRPFTETWEKGKPEPLEQNSFKYLVSQYDIQIIANPQFQVLSFDSVKVGEVKLRKLVALTEKANKKGKITLTLFIEPSRWILAKVVAYGISDESGAFTVTGERVKTSDNEIFKPGDFSVDPSRLAGFQRLPLSRFIGD